MIFSGRTALVVGASRGIGAAVARDLAGAGARLALVARSAAALDALVQELGQHHIALSCDVTDGPAVTAMATHFAAWADGAPDILVCSHGIFALVPADAQDPEEFARTVDVNLVAPFRVIRAFLGAMRARRSGDIVMIGSVSDRHSFAGNAAYGASKFGVRAMLEVIRAETRGSGVRASIVSPGPVDTAAWDAYESQLGESLPLRAEMLRAGDVARAVHAVLVQPAHVVIDELRLSHA